MGKNVIYSLRNLEDWVYIASSLQKELNWDPCCWIAYPHLGKLIKDVFPGCIYHNFFDINKGVIPKELKHYSDFPVDEKLILKLSQYELIALEMMMRMDMLYTLNYHEQIRLYYKLIMYWLNIINYIKPDIVFFQDSPHNISDYILYILCRLHNIDTLMFIPTSVEGRSFIVKSFEDNYEFLTSTYKDELSKINNSMKVCNYDISTDFDKTGDKDDNSMPWYMESYKLQEKKIKKRSYYKYFILLKYIFKPQWFLEIPGQEYYKKRYKTPEESYFNRMDIKLYNIKTNRYKKKLKKYYNKISKNPDYLDNYIYMPLHYQPERTTCPEGGVYFNQFLMISMLSSLLPHNWFIYVKEHPSQFYSFFFGEKCRSKVFYDDICNINNVKLIKLETPSFDLIKKAKAVATVTGTAGWEAISMGIPTLVFGYAWYRSCEGAFFVRTLEDCKEVLNEIINGCQISSHRIKAFVNSINKVSIKAQLGLIRFEDERVIPQENNIKNISEYIIRMSRM